MEKFLAMTDEQKSCLTSKEIEEIKRRVMIEQGVRVEDDIVSKEDIDSLKEKVDKPDFKGYRLNLLDIAFKSYEEAQKIADLINSSESVVRVSHQVNSLFVDKPEYGQSEQKDHCELGEIEVYSEKSYNANRDAIYRNIYLESLLARGSNGSDSSRRFEISAAIDKAVNESRRYMAEYGMYLRIVRLYKEYTGSDGKQALEIASKAYDIPKSIYEKIDALVNPKK